MPPKAAQILASAIGSDPLSDAQRNLLRGVTQALEDARKASFGEPQVKVASATIHDALRRQRWSSRVQEALARARHELTEGKPISVRPRPRAPHLAGYGPPKSAKQKDEESAAKRAAYWKWLKDHGYILPGISEKGRAPRAAARQGDGAMMCANCGKETCNRGEYWCPSCQG